MGVRANIGLRLGKRQESYATECYSGLPSLQGVTGPATATANRVPLLRESQRTQEGKAMAISSE